MQTKKFDSINVVPFIDIMLVLLVIVLTTASFVAHGFIPVDLTEGKSAKKLEKQDILTITVTNENKIFLGKEPISLEELEVKLSVIKKETQININCDKNAKFSNFISIVDIVKSKNLSNLNILTQNKK